MVNSGATAILSLRCWALFGGSHRILAVLIAVYACCLGVQLVSQNRFTITTGLIQGLKYPTIVTFNRPVMYIPEITKLGLDGGYTGQGSRSSRSFKF